MKCTRKAPRGWKCIIEHSWMTDKLGPYVIGPCGLVPRWWNLVDRWKFRESL